MKSPDFESQISKISDLRSIRALKDMRWQSERRLDGLSESVLPELSLDARLVQKDGNSTVGDSLAFDRTDMQVGMFFRHPLGNKSASEEKKKGELEISKINYQCEEAEIEIKAALRELLIRIDGMEKVLDLNLKHLNTAWLKTAEEERLYDQGRGDLNLDLS